MSISSVLLSMLQLFEKMCMALGGRVAESLTFNSVTQGASDTELSCLLRQLTVKSSEILSLHSYN